jgi:hypothetical protein
LLVAIGPILSLPQRNAERARIHRWTFCQMSRKSRFSKLKSELFQVVKASFQYAIVAAVSCAATWAASATQQHSSFAAIAGYAVKPGEIFAVILWLYGVESRISILGMFVAANLVCWIGGWYLLRTLWRIFGNRSTRP